MRNKDYAGDWSMTKQITHVDEFHWGREQIVAAGIDIKIENGNVIFTDVRLTNSAYDHKELASPIFYTEEN